MLTVVNYFLWFIFYSVLGWIMETALFAIRDKKSVKRGFLFGPLCPIYGTGAVLCTVVLYGRISNFFALFAAGLALCDVIEYITSFVLEKLFHAKWWDYSNQRFNIKGRICLTSSLLFGGGVAVLIKWVQPFVMDVTDKIPANARCIAAFVLYSVLIVDIAITVQSLKDIVRKLKEVQQFLIENTQEGIDKADEKADELLETIKTIPSPKEKYGDISEKIKQAGYIRRVTDYLKNDDPQIKKIRGNAPKLQLGNYKEAIDYIFHRPDKNKDSDKSEDNLKKNNEDGENDKK